MNKYRFLLSLTAVAVVLTSSPAARAWDWPWEKPVPPDQILPGALKQFDQLQARIDRKYSSNPHYEDYSHLVKSARSRFETQAKTLTSPSSMLELHYLGEEVAGVLVPDLERRIKTFSRDIPPEKRAEIMGRLEDQRNKDLKTVQREYVARFRPQIQALGLSLQQGGDAAAGIAGAVGTISGQVIDPKGDEDRGMEKILSSPVVKLGRESAEWAKQQATTGGPDKPNGGGGSGGSGGGGPRWPRWNSPRDNDPSAADNAWASNAIANSGGKALEAGNFSEAARMARNALQLDPQNQNALALLNSVKGRVDGGMATAAGGASASARAAALGSGVAPDGASGFAGAPGSARPSPEIAAAAAAGAARVSVQQAEASARTALKLGDTDGAIKGLDKDIADNPGSASLLNLRALAYGKLGLWEKALADANAALSLAPNNPALLTTKALALNRLHRYKEALEASNALLAADPKNAWGYASRAHAWGGLGDKQRMMADINQAALIDPMFKRAAEYAANVQLPSDSDVLFLFPGEKPAAASKAPVAGAGRGRGFGVVMGAGIVGGLLLALGLLSVALEPIKKSVSSVFTKRSPVQPRAAAVVTAQPASSAGEVGGLIRGQYEIARQIGAGGMGMVYEGTDRSLGRRVAIKKMREELRLNARERDRFIIEAKTVASLHHPNIVDIYAIAEEGDDVYLVFEFVDGKTIHDLVQTKGRLSVPEAVSFTKAMGEALTYAHAHGVIHRDMKPSNVMQTSDGRIKVMDFGIARMAKDALTRYSMTNTVVGTPPYMAPEQEQGVVRKESDVYALAICAYEMLTGKLPFIGMGAGMLMNKINMSYIPPSRAIAGLPESLDEVFLKAFQADPERRYRTPAEFVAALSAAADGARSKPV